MKLRREAGDVTFSQPHGSTSADVDGDGIEDFIVGKRYWSYHDTQIDPDAYGDPVLVWYRTAAIRRRREADGRIDIVTPTKFGTFIFWGQGRR